MTNFKLAIIASLILSPLSFPVFADPCPFDANQTCTLQRDVLNDIGTNNLKYYAATNYDHRISGEKNVYDATLVEPTAGTPAGQLKLLLNYVSSGFYKSGEIMTRVNLNQAPYNSPTPSNPWTTRELQHGYLEVIVKMPKCDSSDDGLCQAGTNPPNYNVGLWPAIWMEPTMDANWPENGEIDIAEAYPQNTCFDLSKATLHFNGMDSRCIGNDCRGAGFHLGYHDTLYPLFKDYHKWGFEWQPNPNSTTGGVLLTGYFDNVKVWGPITTDSLPADGPNALSRGFNDTNGGYYLIVNLAIAGPYAGEPNPHLRSASMAIQSIKAYNVGGGTPPPPPTQQYAYYVTVGSPFLKVTINNNQFCPDATGNPRCLVKNQSVGTNMIIAGQSPHLCSLAIQSNGSVVTNPGSNYCYIASTAATSTKPGSISLPSKF